MPAAGSTNTHLRTCNLCEAMCGIQIEVEGDRITSIRGDKDDPFSRGYICPKAAALQDIHADPDRLRHPVRRTPGGFVRVGWDEALDEVAERITAIQRRHGNSAVGFYAGNPTVHNYGAMLHGVPFTRALRTRNRYSATSVDQLPHQFVALLLFGHQLLVPIPDIDRTDHMLILGANPAVSNGSLMTAPGAAKRLAAIRARGGKVVVIDPRRTETAELADRHHFIRPGSDVFLMLALLHTVFAEGLAKEGRLAAFTDGIGALSQIVRDFPPEAAEKPTGIPAGEIRALAREFAAARSAVCYGRVGVSIQEFGAVAQWLIVALNLVTGNLDRPGGAMFTRPAADVVDLLARTGSRGHFDKGRSRVRKLPEFGGEYPVATLADEILTEGKGQIRAMITSAGNPVLSTPNGRKLDQALSSLEFMASIDFYVNETTRHAHVILPPTAQLEHDHYDLIFHALAVHNTAKYSPPLFEPGPDTRHDWQILSDLSARIEARRGGGLAARAKAALLGRLSPARLLDVALRLGPYGDRYNPLSDGLSLAKLKQAPHGVDLGPLAPCLPRRLYSRGKRIDLAPEVLVRGLDRVKEKLRALEAAEAPGAASEAGATGEGFDLILIGRRQLRSNNSWMHNSHRLVKGPDRCTVVMHPEDAARLGLAAAQRVRVSSRVGSIELGLAVSDEVMPGVVSIPHGWGHDRPGVALQTAAQHPGASVNDLTDETFLDELCGNAALNGVPVRVEALDRA